MDPGAGCRGPRTLLGGEPVRGEFLGARAFGMEVDRVKQFTDELAPSRGFDLPIGFFFVPPPPTFDAGLHAPDAGMKRLDPIVILDARPWHTREPRLLGGRAARLLRQRGPEASEQPREAQCLALRSRRPSGHSGGQPLTGSAAPRIRRGRRHGRVLERLAEALRILDEAALDDIVDEAAPASTPTPTPSQRRPRRSTAP